MKIPETLPPEELLNIPRRHQACASTVVAPAANSRFLRATGAVCYVKEKKRICTKRRFSLKTKLTSNPFPGKSALDAFVSLLREKIEQIARKLKTQLENFNDESCTDAFEAGCNGTWKENKDDLSNKIETWFDYVERLAQTAAKSNVASAIALLDVALTQVKSFKKFVESVKISSHKIDEDVKKPRRAVIRGGVRSRRKTTRSRII